MYLSFHINNKVHQVPIPKLSVRPSAKKAPGTISDTPGVSLITGSRVYQARAVLAYLGEGIFVSSLSYNQVVNPMVQ